MTPTTKPDAQDEKAETPKKYKCKYCGEEDDLLINASFHHCESNVLRDVIDAKCAELERVKGERDELQEWKDGWMAHDSRVPIDGCLCDYCAALQRATTAEAALEKLQGELNGKKDAAEPKAPS